MSPKPWARIEVGRMRHPKFLALNGNAIALWDEGKDYCDEHHTDGLIPREALKTFRFSGPKSIAMLTASCGQKPDGSAYVPLWEPHPVGFKMHDYLDHNDCREQILSRMERADERRDTEAKRKADWRSKKKDKADLSHGTLHGTATSPSRSTTEPVPEPETSTPPDGGVPPVRAMAPIHDRSHRSHAHCGRVCLHASLFSEFVRRRNHADADREVRDWALAVDREWSDGGPHAQDEPGDPFEFWKARYAERWPVTVTTKAGTSRAPEWIARAKAGMP